MAETAEALGPQDSALDIATDRAVEACYGDAWDAVRGLLVANAALEEQIAELEARVSTGYARGRVRRIARSG
ncbi:MULTISPECIES: hypothetical protein [Methylopilaceae]|uniref:Uncharacterized protein n=2 Tax=Methylopilaceae TaxID=3149309 RepID=A0A4Q0M9Q8_9HYPH|nr:MULTISPECIES: hypothetical protein [Methylocystaceae]QZO00586.1 hypothetical protein K6K41_02350 [Chenggangzhangella methanolivorans]RXF69950.1 hypothetical protein EK403_17610 [Hansschlegelia zhihuaiae]